MDTDQSKDLAGIEYHGVAGSSLDCQNAVIRLLQFGDQLTHARIISFDHTHCVVLLNIYGDHIAIKSGFSSGYGGEGPRCFSTTLQLLQFHGVEIDECEVEEALIDRLDCSALTDSDIEKINSLRPKRPSRWYEYILQKHYELNKNGDLWREFPNVIPFAIVDSRIIDLALSFWTDPDGKLMTGYRRLEDIIRDRTKLGDSSNKLFARAFNGSPPALTWDISDDGEKAGRVNLFTGAYMAYRNPRSHRELKHQPDEQLAEFLLLNHLYRLEREAISTEPDQAVLER